MCTNKLPRAIFLILLGASFSTSMSFATVKDYQVNTEKSDFKFKAIGKPSFIKIKGGSSDFSGELNLDEEKQTVSGQIMLELGQIKTGISLRDEHLRDKYLEVAKYPQAKLTFKEIDRAATKFKGLLELHGKTREVEVELSQPVELTENAKVQATFSLLLDDFGVEIPSFKGITVASKVELEVNLLLIEKAKVISNPDQKTKPEPPIKSAAQAQ